MPAPELVGLLVTGFITTLFAWLPFELAINWMALGSSLPPESPRD